MSKAIQGSLFEEDYLLRTLGTLAYSPDVALTELVANAWDAGASRVDLQIPDAYDNDLTVEDDGIGITDKDFRKRWMTLGYNRARHQGVDADFPTERASWRRRAYGRNGVGRHGLLCFGSKYTVETWRGGKGFRYVVSPAKGKQPFVLLSQESYPKPGHGTRLSVTVTRRIPYANRIREVLSARFLHDPQFRLFVNDKSVPLTEHTGLIDRATLNISEGKTAEVFFIDSTLAGRTTMHQGVAFWVGSRLVGDPSWIVGKVTLIDGRTRIAKRYTAVVKSDDLFDDVFPDYTAFKESETTQALYAQVCDYVGKMLNDVATERVDETKASVLSEHREALGNLQPLARLEVTEFIGEIAARQPMMSSESMTVAVEAIINLERSRSGVALLEKLAKLSQEDVAGLDKLLSEWSVRDALTVLDEIDRRLVVIEAIKKLSADNTVDEVHTLHPLITQARWLFGPEFDSAEYTSNVSLANAIRQVFGARVDQNAFLNPRKRPDLVILSDATLSAVCTEYYDDSKGLQAIRDLLVIELKRGEATISRDNVHQASDYVEDLLKCGHLDGRPFIKAFVVGHRISDKVESTRTIGENPICARIDVATYGQLVRTGAKRLFSLREQLKSRYEEISGADLFKRASVGDITDQQMQLPDQPSHQKQNGGRTQSPNEP